MLHKEIIVLPIGGIRSIGANCTLYYYDGSLVFLDYGIGITNIDVYTPYDAYIFDINNVCKYFKTNQLNLVITHIHEDHIGGISFLIENFKYLESITIVLHLAETLSYDIVQSKLSALNLKNVNILIHKAETEISISKKFTIKFIEVDHSVPQAYGVVLNISGFKIFHTGDWNINQNIDPQILKFEKFNDIKNKLQAIANTSCTIKSFLSLRNECDLLVGESTKIGDANHKITEEIVSNEINKVIKNSVRKNYFRVFITCFSSQIIRISNIIQVCMNLNIPVFVFGKSIARVMHTNYFKETYEEQFNYVKFLSSYRDFYNKEQGVYIVSGSQNEYNSVLYQLINYYSSFFNNRDLVIFASPIIPGSYKQIEIISDQLIYQKARIMNVMINNRLHASGHAYPDEIKFAYKIIQPKFILPVHGNAIKIQEHINIISDMKINPVVLKNHEAAAISVKENDFKVNKMKVPVDIEDMRVKIGNVFVPTSDEAVSDRLNIIKGGILIINIAKEEIYCYGNIIDDSLCVKIKKEIHKYDFHISKSKDIFTKRIKNKFGFNGLIKIIN